MFFGEWLIYAILALVGWGAVNVMDTFFVEEEIYENATEGMIISSLFKAVGFFVVYGLFYKEAISVDLVNILLSILGGALLSGAFWFYFRAAMMYNDLSLVQVFWNLATPIVAVISWYVLDDKLEVTTYIGMGIVVIGAMLISFSRKSMNVELGKFFLLNIPLVILYSLSEVVIKYVEVSGIDFWASFPYICLGQFLFGLQLLIFNWDSVQQNRLFERVSSGNWKLQIFSETVELGAFFFMMLSIAKTPAIAFHAVTEGFMPLVVIGVTGIAGFCMKKLGKSKSLSEVYKNNHTAGIWGKVFATVVMAVGIYFIE